MSIRARHRIKKQVARGRRIVRPWPGRVGDGSGTIEVPGYANLWYVRPEGSDLPIPVYRGSAPREDGYPVWVGQDVYNKRWLRILGVDYERAVNGGITVTEVGPHASSHLINGSDPAYIDARQVVNVLAYASTGMIVHVNAGWVIIDGQPVKVAATNIDMTASIPGSGAAYSIIRADSDGVLDVVDGTPVDSLLDLDDSDAPAFADGYAAIALVRLWFGMTELSRSSTQPDVTPLYLAQVSKSGGGTPDAHHTTHESGGDDEIKLDDLGTPDDNTDLDATITEHGLLPKLSGSITDVLRGDGTWGGGAGSRITTLSGDGAWCWFADPRAVYKDGKTYFGYIDNAGNIKVRQYNHITKALGTETTLHATLEVDDHDNPSILVRASDKKILAFYSKHVGAELYYRLSSNAEDTTAWAAETNIDSILGGNYYTYPSPFQLTGEANDPIYLFFRHHTAVDAYPVWSFSKSTDDGGTWAAKTDLIDVSGNYSPYVKIHSNGIDRIDFFFTSAHPSEGSPSLYHFYYTGGNYYKTDGTQITASLPIEPSDATLVYDGTSVGGWVWDVAMGTDGNPVAVFASFESSSDHRYNYARWDGLEWDVTEITAAGGGLYSPEVNYSGGIVLDHTDPSIVWLSKAVGSAWEIYRGKTEDNGATWSLTAITSSGGSVKNIRPAPIINHAPDLAVLYLTGTYTTYTNYNLDVMGVEAWEDEAGTDITLFDDTEGDPASVDETAASDGTSEYAARRDHRHQIGDIDLNDLGDVDTSGTGTGDVIYNNAGTWEDYPLGVGSKITISGSKIRFGNVGDGHYIEIDATTGNFRLVGTATSWDDLRLSGSSARVGVTAPSVAAFGPSGSLRTLRFEQGHHDEIYFEIQMPHNWLEGSNIHPHVHWSPVTTEAGDVVWQLDYSWANIDETFGAPTTMTTDATAAGGTAWVHKLSQFKDGSSNAYIDGTGKTLSSMLVMRLHRDAGAGSDTLSEDVAFLEFDLHYQVDGFGSDDEYVKNASSSLLLESGDYFLLESGDNLLLE